MYNFTDYCGVKQKRSLGEWVFRSKSSEMNCSPTGACKGQVFALEVTEELDSWAEQSSHTRRWVYLQTIFSFFLFLLFFTLVLPLFNIFA